MRLFAVLATTTLLAVAPAAAADAPTDSPVAADAKPDATAKLAKPKKVCRLAEAPTGSRLTGRRTCKTADEWAEFDNSDGATAKTPGASPVSPVQSTSPGR